jgi:hypothetical protein
MKTIRLHTTADQNGMIHLHLPSAQPNSEVDVEVIVRETDTARPPDPGAIYDRQFFATILGDRVRSRSRQRAVTKSR